MKKSDLTPTIEETTNESPSAESVESTTTAEAAVDSPVATAAMSHEDRLAAAESMVRNHALVAAGIGFIPVPYVDFIGLTATQLKLLKSLGDLYGVKFIDEPVKKTVAALINGYAPLQFAPFLASAIKMVPLIGQSAGALSMASIGGGITYGIGKVFVQHFESGGTFLNFEPQKVREYFKSQFKIGTKLAVKPEEASAAA
jgi:uncharacterized protein (DUF697 family)